jgi:hypothetical protein
MSVLIFLIELFGAFILIAGGTVLAIRNHDRATADGPRRGRPKKVEAE